ncbi:MAG: prepilin peptidase [Halomonadaceae bacterium]|nr:MAG: prepilin peptidase [Halomonadaceae bacterium]
MPDFSQLLSQLVAQPWLFYPTLAIFSLCVGSFLNVVILRLPRMMEQQWRCDCEELLEVPEGQRTDPKRFDLSFPGSHCPKCDHALRVRDNIPLFSYLFLKGRCAHCSAPIPVRYPIVEGMTLVLSLVTVVTLGPTLTTLATLLLVWSLIALAVIDLDTQLLPDSITLPLIWAGLLFNYFAGLVPFDTAFWGAVAGYLSLWGVYHLFRILTGKHGMGYGDFKLLAALGAWLGWTMLPAIILLSSLVGAVVGISLILFRGQGRDVPIPFGPYLAAAGLLTLWWGTELQIFWYRLLGF